VIDEEKSSSNQLNEIKEEKKESPFQFYFSTTATQPIVLIHLCCLLKANLPPAPLVEKPTPPPNYC